MFASSGVGPLRSSLLWRVRLTESHHLMKKKTTKSTSLCRPCLYRQCTPYLRSTNDFRSVRRLSKCRQVGACLDSFLPFLLTGVEELERSFLQSGDPGPRLLSSAFSCTLPVAVVASADHLAKIQPSSHFLSRYKVACIMSVCSVLRAWTLICAERNILVCKLWSVPLSRRTVLFSGSF